MVEMAVARGAHQAPRRARLGSSRLLGSGSGRVRQAASRYALRGLVVAGVAGAAWLFWSASASANATPASAAPSNEPVAGGVLDAVLAPVTESAPVSHLVGTVVSTASTVPVVAELTQPVAAVAAPVIQTAAPVIQAAAPVVHRLVSTTHLARRGWATRVSGPRLSTMDNPRPMSGASTGMPDAMLTAAVPAAAVHPAVREVRERQAAASRPSASPVGDRAGPRGEPNQPGRNFPAPLGPLPLPPASGAGLIGAFAGANGSTVDGGATAVLAPRNASAPMVLHGAVAAADVATRPLPALVPTVSPD
jgi:hypothetical protein